MNLGADGPFVNLDFSVCASARGLKVLKSLDCRDVIQGLRSTDACRD